MKKIINIGLVTALTMGVISCQKEGIAEVQNSGKLVKETFSATIGQDVTKTATTDDGETITWAANDKVHYYTSDGGALRNFTISSEGSSASLTLERGTSDTYYNLIYAGNTSPVFTTKTNSSMVFDGIKSAQDGSFANANVSVARTTPGGSGITFNPVTALVKFSTSRTDIKTIVLTGGAGTEKVAGDITVDPTAASPKGTLNGDGSTSITVTIDTPAAGTYFINVLPIEYTKGLKLTLKNSSEVIGTVIASKSIDLSAGGKMINLGNIDSHINDLSSAGAANCYIVYSAGTYTFKAVQGNTSNSVGTVSSVAVLWESFGTSTAPSVGDLVNSVSYSGNYISFSATDKKGNAVIAAKDAGGTILWSWHIWLTDKPAEQVYNNNAGTMMDRNLGATSTTPGDVHALGLLYQWGRKDPFLSGESISSDTEAKSTASWPSPTQSTHLTGSLDYADKHPMQIITQNTINYDWYYTGYETTDNTRWQTSDNSKGKYDPCPSGWRVPNGGSDGVWSIAFGRSSYWTTPSNWDSTNRGMDLGASDVKLGTGIIWYPSAGARSQSGPYYYGNAGFYWSSTPKGKYAYHMEFNDNGFINPSNACSRALGYSIRCIKE